MKVVIVGSGIGGITTASELKKIMPEYEVTLITKESSGYYSRPLLSAGFALPNIEKRIVIMTFEKVRQLGVNLLEKTEVTKIDRDRKQIQYQTDAGESQSLEYDRLVLALGSQTMIPSPWQSLRNEFFTLDDIQEFFKIYKLRNEIITSGRKPSWAVIGGGISGAEIANTFIELQDDVIIYHLVDRLIERTLTPEKSQELFSILANKGIDIKLNCETKELKKENQKWKISYQLKGQNEMNQMEHDAIHDAVIVTTGFRPRIDLPKSAELKTDLGLNVNATLQTNDPNIFGVGDGVDVEGKGIFAFIAPIRHQAVWLAQYLSKKTTEPWQPPAFKKIIKVKGFNLE